MRINRRILWSALPLGALLVLVLWAALWTAPGPAPDYAQIRQSWQPSQSALLDRHGEIVHVRRTDFSMRRAGWTTLDAISPALQNAIIAAEDKRFYRHKGVDWHGIAGAAWSNARGKPLRGASTITMQVASLIKARSGHKFARHSWRDKVRQARLANAVEHQWNKAQILETYLNLLSFRGEIEGVTAAANVLLGKAPNGLTAEESLALAALLPAPNAGRERLQARLCALVSLQSPASTCDGPLKALETIVARAEIPPQTAALFPQLAPHLAARLLGEDSGNLRTTLDGQIQRFAKDALARQLAQLAHRNVRDGAVLVVENASGNILAWVGSNESTSRSPFVDGVRAQRQAGSTLKPHLYGLAIERRYLTAASLLNDAPINLETAGGLYVPQNYDHGYKGLVSARVALGNSLNIPAVRTLLLTGIEPFRERLFDLGYKGIVRDGDYYGFSLALGSAEVSLAQQVNAYRTFANGGRFSALRLRADAPIAPARQIFGEDTAFIVSSMLSDRSARLLTFGLSNNLNTSFWSAVKTGTSKAMRDNWTIGYSADYTVGVWVGNFEGDSMHGVSGVSGAAPLWHEIISALPQNRTQVSAAPPPMPKGVVQANIQFGDEDTARREVFLRGTEIAHIRAVPPGTRRARLLRPASGAIIALDPDIPFERQRIAIAAQNLGPGMVLELDGQNVDNNSLWFPLPGQHQLILLDENRQKLDQIEFRVRGGNF